MSLKLLYYIQSKHQGNKVKGQQSACLRYNRSRVRPPALKRDEKEKGEHGCGDGSAVKLLAVQA